MEKSKAKQFLLKELGRIRAETLDDLDLAVQCEWSNEIAKKHLKNNLGNLERMIKEMLDSGAEK